MYMYIYEFLSEEAENADSSNKMTILVTVWQSGFMLPHVALNHEANPE